MLEGRLECPECGDMGPHDDNGVTGPERAYACRACGMCFEPHHDDA
jgi:rubredoxin